MISRRRAAFIGLTLLLTGSIGAASAQADRREPVPFDLFSGTTQTEGRAKAKGKVRFLDNGRLRVKGYINDICPGDGFAAVLEIEVSYNDVTRDIRRRTHGLCHENKRDVDFKTRRFQNVSQVAVIANEIRYSDERDPGRAGRLRRAHHLHAERLRRRVRALIVALAALALPAPALAHDGGPRVPDWKPVSVAAQQRAEPPIVATPRADCLPGSVPEGPMQGRVPAGAEGYRCNLSVIGQAGETGGFRVHRYVDRDGRECAYYDTTLLFPTNALSLSGEPTGVAVLDMTDPSKPVHTTTLITPAMQTPHESLNISVERGLLAAVMGNPAFAPGVVDVYDISRDCRHPELMASAPASVFGHESGMALDGRTFYPTSISTDQTTAVDLSDPRLPRPIWQGQFNTHGMSVSDDGNRGYLATRRRAGHHRPLGGPGAQAESAGAARSAG